MTGSLPPGAQAERTALAWRRTALSVAAGAAVAARLVAPAAGGAAWALVVVGGTAAAALSWTATRRYLAARRVLEAHGGEVPGPGVPTALLAALASLTGGLAVWYVLSGG